MVRFFKGIALFSLWLMPIVTAPVSCFADTPSIDQIIAEMPINDLPAPSGNRAVGTMRMDFINPSRLDFLANTTSSQKMSVQVWYPAQRVDNCARSTWMDERATPYAAALFGIPQAILLRMCQANTNSYWNAPLLKRPRKYPVVLFSTGLTGINNMNTIQMEELASNGFIVVSVSHPGLDFAVVCADGDVIYPDMNQVMAVYQDQANAEANCPDTLPALSPERYREVIRLSTLSNQIINSVWAEDFKFIAERLTDLNTGAISSIFKGKLDMNNMAVFGHSFGGAASGQLCLADSRYKAFMNLDGTPYGTTVDNVISAPFAVITTNVEPYYLTYTGYNESQSDFFEILMADAAHAELSDINTVAPTLNDVMNLLGGANIVLRGTIPIDTLRTMLNDYVLSFFKHYMIGSDAPLFNQNQDKYPYASMTVVGNPYDKYTLDKCPLSNFSLTCPSKKESTRPELSSSVK